MTNEQRQLEFLYNQYLKQIDADHRLKDKVAKKMKKFAPFKEGERVRYIPEYGMSGIPDADDFHNPKLVRYGIIESCEYKPEDSRDNEGKWEISIKPTNKNFEENRREFSLNWLPIKYIRKFK